MQRHNFELDPPDPKFTFDSDTGKKLAKLSYNPQLKMLIRVKGVWYKVTRINRKLRKCIGVQVPDPHNREV